MAAAAEEPSEGNASIDFGASGSMDMARSAPSFFGESSRRKKKKPGAKWDGRVSSLTLEEYRAMKWGLDAGFRASLRGGPKYSMRPALSKPLRKNSDGMLDVDVNKAFDACHNTGPKFSMGKIIIGGQIAPSPGPQYKIGSTMDPDSHPTIPKHTGTKFGTETLQVLDEDAPAPGQYDQMTYKLSGQIKRLPSYTMQGREAWNDPTEAPGPAPGEYKYEKATRVGKLTPLTWSMQGKTEPISPARGERATVKPGPGHYPIADMTAKNGYSHLKYKPPNWTFSQDSRGLNAKE
eukprot:TRINITY_DN107322_c0_g1_i1.p1 TRINITY_DN107322_c0_g1~~TRINITY_DN107322_c0_g1_i1.p1  ORF type:complete len:304 (+),score=55.66 TRINITY_DN107322_c0_g1_i1:37-912(+)